MDGPAVLTYLSARLDHPVVLLQRRTYQEVNRLLDFAWRYVKLFLPTEVA
jgi:hypothetical protein